MTWRPCCGQECPRSQVVFLCQVLVLSTMAVISLYSLSWGRGHCHSDVLWASLLSASIGLSTPGPVVDWHWYKKRRDSSNHVDTNPNITVECQHGLLSREHEISVWSGAGDPTAAGGPSRGGSGRVSLHEELV